MTLTAKARPTEVRLRAQLAQREQLTSVLEGLLESMADGVVALDLEGRVVHLSDSLREPSRAMSCGDAVLADEVLEPLRAFAATLSAGRPGRFELDWSREEFGQRRYRVVAATGELDGPLGASRFLTLFAFHDLTRERTLEAELAQSRQLAALGQMAATVAHEVRNPLAAIQGFTTLLQRDLPPTNDSTRLIGRILQGVDDANRIVADLLEYCRPVRSHCTAVQVEALLTESLTALRDSPRWRDSVHLDLQIDPGLPPVAIDRALLLQALSNLYDNALDAMEKEKGVLSVRARALGDLTPCDRVRFVVRDTGPGMTAEQVARIFEPFYTTKPKGTGLGLAVVRRTVEHHGGQIHVVSSTGRGTSVVIDLPAGRVGRLEGYKPSVAETGFAMDWREAA